MYDLPSERPKSAQEQILEAVRAAEEAVAGLPTPPCERKTHIVMSGFSRSNSNLALDRPETTTHHLPSDILALTPVTSTPVSNQAEPARSLRESHSPIPQHPSLHEEAEDEVADDLNLNHDTPMRKMTMPLTFKPAIAPKPRDSRATSEPPTSQLPVLSGGEPVSLPSTQGSTDSPMPELLSLKDRLKLFEKEITDQSKITEPKKDRKFSFLSDDEVVKMKEEEAKRIASMTAMDLEMFDSLTSQQSLTEEREVLDKQVSELERYDVGDVSDITSASLSEELDNGLTAAERKGTEAEKRAAWRKARLQSLESDAIQAQIVIEKMSELSSSDLPDHCRAEDNAAYLLPVDVQGNLLGEMVTSPETDSEMMRISEDITTPTGTLSPLAE